MNNDRVFYFPPIAQCTKEIRALHESLKHKEPPAAMYRGRLILNLDVLTKLDPRMN